MFSQCISFLENDMLKRFCLFNYFDGKSNENIKDFVVDFDHLKKFSKDFQLFEQGNEANKLQKSTMVKEFNAEEAGVDHQKYLQK